MSAADERAEQIRSRLDRGIWDPSQVLADLAFLLAERADWIERAGGEAQRADEASERADQAEAERTELLRRVEQAERAGAVKALRSVGMSDQADLVEMGRFTITGQPIVADLYDRTGQETKGVRE